MRLTTINVGTNTVLLRVADVKDGVLMPVHEAERVVRLGEGVDATGNIGSAALERLRAVLLHYRAVGEELGAERIVVAGTSASRNSANRDGLSTFVRCETVLV